MPTYVYEAVTRNAGEKRRSFEFEQHITDEPLTEHPETGEPIRRVVLGGFGVLRGREPAGGSGSCCASGTTCCE